MTEKTFLMRLDDVVRWPSTKIFGRRGPSRRPLRWASTIALMFSLVGFIMLFVWPSRQWALLFLLIIGNGLGSYMPLFGPLKLWGSTELVDERERGVRAQVYLIALSALAFTGILGALFIVGWSMMADWSIWSLRISVIGLTLLMTTIYTAGSTCIASWIEPEIIGDDLA